MKASDLNYPTRFYSPKEKENSQAYSIHENYKKYLNYAKGYKIDYLHFKAMQKTETYESLDKLVVKFKELAIKMWEKSQKYLAEYNEFEKNRKYPNI